LRIPKTSYVDALASYKKLFSRKHGWQDLLVTGLAGAQKLRAVHINYPLGDDTQERSSSPILSSDEALRLIRQCGSTITEFGCNTRVWQVNRVAITDTLGQITVEPQLLPYDFPEVPEQFLVV